VPQTAPVAGNFIQSMLDSHNRDRARYASPSLVWDEKLATVAQNYANGCKWGHNDQRSAQYGSSAGENIAMASGTPGIPSYQQWADEEKDWTCDLTKTGACNGVCGHWTQILWKDTTKVGCALAKCNTGNPFGSGSWNYLVCDYATAGNWNNQAAVSRCPSRAGNRESDTGSQSSSGLGAGVIAAIVVSSVIVVALFLAIGMIIFNRKKEERV